MKKRADGLYAKKLTIGHDENGKSITKTVYGKTQKEVNEKAEIIKNKGNPKKHNFKKLVVAMLEEREKIVGYKTMECYKLACAKLKPIYNKSIEEITPATIEKILNDLAAQHFSKSLLTKVRLVYSMTAKYAIKNNINVQNYSKEIEIPKNAEQGKRDGLTDAEIKIIEDNVNNEFGLYPFFMMYTGLRRGELCALQWKDIDLNNKIIYVNKSISFENNRPILKPPKTKNGLRTVPILDKLLSYVINKGNDDDFIFSGEKPYSLTMIRKRWNKYIEQHKLDITQHQLRHTYATMLYKAGIDPKTAQALLGHADVQTTLNIYTHIGENIKQGEVDKINSFLKKSSKKVVEDGQKPHY